MGKIALIHCDFYSEVLNLSTSMTVILPEQTQSQIGMKNKKVSDKHPTLYLLHGFSDDHTIWTRRTSIERYVSEMGLAVVMPNVHHSFYTDMEYGNRYWTFLTEELPEVARSFFPLSEKREDNFVAGLSMGGYGALKWALRYPEKFAAAASLSGALDMAARIEMENDGYDPFKLIFGDRDIADTEDDLLWLLKQGDKKDQPRPRIYQTCGTEDFLYEANMTFKKVCDSTTYELTTDFGPGDHNWSYWDQKIQDVLTWLPLGDSPPAR